MKKIIIMLLAVVCILVLPACKKIIDSIIPTIPDEPVPTSTGTPVGDMSSKTIGKDGGSIGSPDGKVELIFPAGAVDDNTSISIQAITNNAPNGVGNAYRFLPDGIKFQQPVTLKFHYTADDLAATLADLMGIAFQDNTGVWYRLNNFTNDTINKVISSPIKHFTDYTHFDMLFIDPASKTIKVNENMDLNLAVVESDDSKLKKSDAGEDLAPLITLADKKVIWSASSGTLNASTLYATYQAPAKVPSKNPVAISAQVDVNFKYHGKIFDKTPLVSNITIYDNEKYLLEIRETQTATPFVYTDTASLTVLVSADGKVTVSEIVNFAPKNDPSTASLGECTATWIADAIGEINITDVTGSISGSPGDPNRVLILQFKHSGTVTPKFHRVCLGGDDVTEGGMVISGYPSILSFTLTPDAGIYFQDDGEEFARLTLQ